MVLIEVDRRFEYGLWRPPLPPTNDLLGPMQMGKSLTSMCGTVLMREPRSVTFSDEDAFLGSDMGGIDDDASSACFKPVHLYICIYKKGLDEFLQGSFWGHAV